MLDISLGLILSVGVIFLVTMYLLNKWLFKPLTSFMQEREAKLNEELSMTESNIKEIEKLEKEIEEILTNAKKEAAKIREEARLKALKEIEELRNKKETEIEKAKQELKKEIAQEKEKILNELKKESSNIKSLIENKIRNAA